MQIMGCPEYKVIFSTKQVDIFTHLQATQYSCSQERRCFCSPLLHQLRSCHHELSTSLFSMCLSLLWIGALGPSQLVNCVYVCVCMSMNACCPQNTLLILLCSVTDTSSGFSRSPLVSLVLCLLHLFTPPKRSEIHYPSSFSAVPSIFHYSLLFTPDSP